MDHSNKSGAALSKSVFPVSHGDLEIAMQSVARGLMTLVQMPMNI